MRRAFRDIDAASVREFMSRDWGAFERSRLEALPKWTRRVGVAGSLDLADDLRLQIKRYRPDHPTPAARREDHATHIRVSDALRRVRGR